MDGVGVCPAGRPPRSGPGLSTGPEPRRRDLAAPRASAPGDVRPGRGRTAAGPGHRGGAGYPGPSGTTSHDLARGGHRARGATVAAGSDVQGRLAGEATTHPLDLAPRRAF